MISLYGQYILFYRGQNNGYIFTCKLTVISQSASTKATAIDQ